MATLTRMWRRLRRVVQRWSRLVGAYFGPIVARAGQDAESRRRIGAQARFWAELREGQREAQAYSERRR
jgi:hypothetical protein